MGGMATSAASAALSRLPTHRAIVERLSATLAPVAALNVSNDSAAHAGHSGTWAWTWRVRAKALCAPSHATVRAVA